MNDGEGDAAAAARGAAELRRRLLDELAEAALWRASRPTGRPGSMPGRSRRAGGGDWRIWVMLGGRGFGKTRAGAEWISQLARDHPGAAIALVAATLDEARRVMVEGRSGLIAVARRGRATGDALGAEPAAAGLRQRSARRSSIRARMPIRCAGRSIISPGATSWRNGGRREAAGTI